MRAILPSSLAMKVFLTRVGCCAREMGVSLARAMAPADIFCRAPPPTTSRSRPQNPTSVLPSRPDLADGAGHVGFVPNAEAAPRTPSIKLIAAKQPVGQR